MHWALNKDKVDKGWVMGQLQAASACHFALKDSYPRSRGAKGVDTEVLVEWTKAFIVKCGIKLNSTININSRHPTVKQSESRLLLRVSQNEPEWKPWVGIQSGSPEWETLKQVALTYTIAALKYNSRMSLLKSSKYTMRLQCCYNEGGLMSLMVQTHSECSNSLN